MISRLPHSSLPNSMIICAVLRLKRRFHTTSYQGSGKIEEWVKTLPFVLTDDQKKAIDAIKSDLSGEVAARRMIVGDVGSGKTMVILASVVLMRPYRQYPYGSYYDTCSTTV